MANYAIIKDNKVINTCAWDGITEWQPPEGTEAVIIQDGVVAGMGYDYIDGRFIAPPPAVITGADNKLIADQILTDTDWTSIPAVGNPNQSNPYLVNQTEWLVYRSKIRAISTNPPEGEIVWPLVPQEQWSE